MGSTAQIKISVSKFIRKLAVSNGRIRSIRTVEPKNATNREIGAEGNLWRITTGETEK